MSSARAVQKSIASICPSAVIRIASSETVSRRTDGDRKPIPTVTLSWNQDPSMKLDFY